jgi:hypothetical protein
MAVVPPVARHGAHKAQEKPAGPQGCKSAVMPLASRHNHCKQYNGVKVDVPEAVPTIVAVVVGLPPGPHHPLWSLHVLTVQLRSAMPCQQTSHSSAKHCFDKFKFHCMAWSPTAVYCREENRKAGVKDGRSAEETRFLSINHSRIKQSWNHILFLQAACYNHNCTCRICVCHYRGDAHCQMVARRPPTYAERQCYSRHPFVLVDIEHRLSTK